MLSPVIKIYSRYLRAGIEKDEYLNKSLTNFPHTAFESPPSKLVFTYHLLTVWHTYILRGNDGNMRHRLSLI